MKTQPQNRIPAYLTDKRQLFQITEFIIEGKVVVERIPLQAYQTIELTANS